MAFRVKDIEKSSEGLEVLQEHFLVGSFLRVGFFRYADGMVLTNYKWEVMEL